MKMIPEFKEKLLVIIGNDSYHAWFRPEIVTFSSSLYGVLKIEALSLFYRDTIIKRFGSTLSEVATALGYPRCVIIARDEEMPQYDPPLSPEQWDQVQAILKKVGSFARSAGNDKPSSFVFSAGPEEDIVEAPPARPKAACVYQGMEGLGKWIGGKEAEDVLSESNGFEDEGVLFSHAF